ncbi:MAG: GNAT family N-acetyltransferase [Chloroflexia bacterium]
MGTPRVRRAKVGDVEALVRLRVALLREMGAVDEAGSEPLAGAIRRYLMDELPDERFLAWVGVDDAGTVVACGGLVFLQKPPSPGNHSGREAYIMNMYTVPEWRGRGLASRMFATIVGHAREAGAELVRLHATEDGRAIYERGGFRLVGNEMVLRLT